MSRKSIDLKHDRRQWLKASATLLGTSLLPAPAIAAEEKPKVASEKPSSKASGRFLNPQQHTLVEEMSETIIPADAKSGGAKAARVVDYIELEMRDRASDSRQTDFREGLRLVDLMSQHYCGKSFLDATPDERVAVFTVLSTNVGLVELAEVRFFRDLRSMTIDGYYSSKIGIHDELEYKGNVVLQEYVGCEDAPKTT